MTNTSHTQGLLTYEGNGDITGIENDPDNGCVGKVDVASVYLRTVPGRHDANARRLVACWNACEGLGTEFIERMAEQGDTFASRFELHVATQVALIDERDTLLDALRAFLRAPHAGSGGMGATNITVQDFNLRAAHAAIAKVEGGAA